MYALIWPTVLLLTTSGSGAVGLDGVHGVDTGVQALAPMLFIGMGGGERDN